GLRRAPARGFPLKQFLEPLGGGGNVFPGGAWTPRTEANDENRRQRQEPRRLIKECTLADHGGARAPRTVFARGAHLEAVRARLQIRVDRMAPCSGVDPLMIETFQSVLIV